MVALSNLLIEPGDNLLTAINPLVPVLPDEWTGLPLFFQEIDAFMKLSHTLSNLLGRLCIAQLLRGQRLCMKKFLEASIGEGAK